MATKDYERSDSSQRALTYRSALASLKEHKKTAAYKTQLRAAIDQAARDEVRATTPMAKRTATLTALECRAELDCLEHGGAVDPFRGFIHFQLPSEP